MKKKVLIIGGVVLGVLVLIGGVWFGVSMYQRKLNNDLVTKRAAAAFIDKVTIGYAGAITGYYPNMESELTSYNFHDHVYDGLVQFDEELRIVPAIAESWENPSEKTWRFRIRKDVTFHNNAKLTADDVEASVNLVLQNESLASLISTVESVTKVDAYTVDIKTKTPTPALANSFPYVFILPKDFIAAGDFTHPIGAGEYKFVSGDETSWTLERFDNYYGEKPKVKNVVLKSGITEENDRFTAVKNGDLDAIEIIEKHEGELKTNGGKSIKIGNMEPLDASFITFDMNRDQNPLIKGVTTNPLKDIKVRTAIQLALDVPKIIKDVDAIYTEPASQLVPSSVFGYNPDIKPSKQDLVEAKRLMKEAGYEKGFTITLDIMTVREKLANAVKTQLAEIGVVVELNLLEPNSENIGLLMGGERAMTYLSWVSNTGDGLEGYSAVFDKEGLLGYQNQAFQDLLDKAMNTFDQTKRKEYMKQMAEIVDTEKPLLYIYSTKTAYAYQDGIVVVPRADQMLIAREMSGAVGEDIKNNYTFFGALKKLIGLK
jgi:peptide/nickel transport system substrate-binding protein